MTEHQERVALLVWNSEMWYNPSCLASGNGAFFFSNADGFSNTIIVGKTPLISGLSSRQMLDTSAANEGRFTMAVNRECANCNQSLKIPPSRARVTKNSYCNRKCQEEHRQRTGFYCLESNSNWRGGLAHKRCKRCDSPFSVKQKEVRAGRGKFCSVGCARRYISENALGYDPKVRIKKSCAVCGEAVYIKPSHANTESSYCSTECMSIDYSRRMAGESNPNYRHGKANSAYYRALRAGSDGTYSDSDIDYLFRQQSGLCPYCHKEFAETGYHIEHRIPIVRGGSNFVGNLQLTCPTCNFRKGDKTHVEFLRYLRRINV